MTKIHIGSGAVYLEGYINVDVEGERTFLAEDRPDLVERLKTTDALYYARHQDKTIDTLRKGPLDQEQVCDVYGSFSDLPGSSWTAEEILARHVFEHMSLTEAHRALDECDKKLKEGGVLRLDVPDHEQTLLKYAETKDTFYVRHLFGPRKNEYGYHIMSYTRELLKKVVEAHGFIFEREEENIHFYPAFCLRFKKPRGREPRDYALEGVTLENDWKILDVGPGAYPLLQATHYIDISQNRLENLPGHILNKDIEKDELPYEYKYFDYVFCSHVLEHVDNPEVVLKKLSFIGKRGTVVVPSAFKEFLFLWEEPEHKWWIFPPKVQGGPIQFMKKTDGWADKLYNLDASKALCRLFRSGPNTIGNDQRILRRWYYEHEKNLDVVVHWENEICLTMI